MLTARWSPRCPRFVQEYRRARDDDAGRLPARAQDRHARPPPLLMPMAFGSLLGGLVTLVGTSPNIIVSRVREEILGQPFSMFDFAPVGIVLALAGLVFLAFGWRLLPRAQRRGASMDDALQPRGLHHRGHRCRESPKPSVSSSMISKQLARTHSRSPRAPARAPAPRSAPVRRHASRAGDVLSCEGEPAALERVRRPRQADAGRARSARRRRYAVRRHRRHGGDRHGGDRCWSAHAGARRGSRSASGLNLLAVSRARRAHARINCARCG